MPMFVKAENPKHQMTMVTSMQRQAPPPGWAMPEPMMASSAPGKNNLEKKNTSRVKPLITAASAPPQHFVFSSYGTRSRFSFYTKLNN